MITYGTTFKCALYRGCPEHRGYKKCYIEVSKFQNKSTRSSTRKKREQDRVNPSLLEQHSLKNLRYDKMSLNVDEIIQDELERIEQDKNQKQTSEAAEKAVEA